MLSLSRIRSTTDSPWTLGIVTDADVDVAALDRSPTRPSCGMRRSEMSRSLMILMREMTPETIRLGTRPPRRARRRRASGPGARGRPPAVRRPGFEVDVRCAAFGGLGDDRVHELDHRRVLGRLAQVDDLQRASPLPRPPDRLLDRVLESVHPRDQRRDVIDGGDGRLDVQPRQQRDVVDRDHVGRVGHREHESLLVYVRHRHRPVALGRAALSRLAAAMSTLKTLEVEVVKPVALGDRLRELIPGDRLLLHQQPLGRHPSPTPASSIALWTRSGSRTPARPAHP